MELPKKFEWDAANRNKNKRKHGVEWFECEEIFFNSPLLVSPDPKHSTTNETRYQALGQTNFGRQLTMSFTIRHEKIRLITARNQSRKERKVYEEASAKKT